MNIRINTISGKKKSRKLNQATIQKLTTEKVQAIRQLFSKEQVHSIACETEFIKRTAKIGAKDFLTTMLMASLDSSHTSLERISSILTRVNPNHRVTAQSIMERINNPTATMFFMKIQEMVLKQRVLVWTKTVPPFLLSYFSKVLIQDSTVFELHEDLQEDFKGSGGRSSKSCAKIDVIYDLLAKRYERFTVTDQSRTDSSLAAEIEDLLTDRTLVIRDMGYLRIDALESVIRKKGYYLSRLKSNFQMFMEPDSEIAVELSDFFLDETQVIDIRIYITQDRLPVRLVAYRAPQEVVDKRKRAAKATAKKQGRMLTQNSLKLMEFTIFITNVPPEYWCPEVVGTIYAIRWQIELMFKSWKTGMKIHYLKGINPNRIRALIYVRLILLILINEIYKFASWLGETMNKIVSMHKVFLWIKDSERFLKMLRGTLKQWEKRYFLDMVLRSMCRQKRKRKTTLEAISEGMFYEEYYSLA